MQINFPKNHRKIVDELMGGKFLLSTDPIFDDLKQNEEYYTSFFQNSFGYELKVTQEYSYLISDESNEMLSRDISIFFAILSYEMDRNGKNFLDQFQYGEFDLEAIDNYFDNSSYTDLIQATKQLKDHESRKQLLNMMSRRNIIEKTGEDRFVFTNSYKVFMDFANELAKWKFGNPEMKLN